MKECLVVGIPRCGTTWLFRCIAGLPPGPGSPKGAALEKLPVMKAHSLAPPATFGDPWAKKVREHAVEGGKCIFIFGDPVLAVISTRKHRWDKVHARNCGWHGELDSADIFLRDCFSYENMFDTWMSSQLNVLRVRYEALWDLRSEIEVFLGRKIHWNDWKRRSTQIDHYPTAIVQAAAFTYERLIGKIQTAWDITYPGAWWKDGTERNYSVFE